MHEQKQHTAQIFKDNKTLHIELRTIKHCKKKEDRTSNTNPI